MKFKLNVSPGVVIFVLGFIGLVTSLAENSGQIGGKVPLALFFLFIIGMGIAIEIKLKKGDSDTFGEMESNKSFG